MLKAVEHPSVLIFFEASIGKLTNRTEELKRTLVILQLIGIVVKWLLPNTVFTSVVHAVLCFTFTYTTTPIFLQVLKRGVEEPCGSIARVSERIEEASLWDG